MDRSTASQAFDELSSRGLIKRHVGRGTLSSPRHKKLPHQIQCAMLPCL
ncbi:MAG: hypothetical protein IPO31_24815 [Candidatus Obscuribacter sp.]|nr:hypothetical protein [Candidatus Obscuribacter sp.]